MTLAEYLRSQNIRPAEFARLVDVPRQYVSRWANGHSAPRPAHMHRISKATRGKVTANDFFAPIAKPQSEKAVA